MSRELDTPKRRALMIHLHEKHNGTPAGGHVSRGDDYPQDMMRRNHRRAHEDHPSDHEHPGIKNRA